MNQGFFALSAVQKERPSSLIAKCGSCGLYKTCQSPKMKPYGKGLRNVLVIGEAPGRIEDEEGRPFVGNAGQLLRDTLSSLDIDLDTDAVTTNACICRPPDNQTPDDKQIGCCHPNVLKAIRDVEPVVLVVLGKTALQSVLMPFWKDSVGSMERWAGAQIPIGGRFWICPTYHPSYLLRTQSRLLDRTFARHLAAAFDKTEPPPRQALPKIDIILDDAKAARAIRDFDRKGALVAVDYETNCLKPEYPKSRIVSCAISDGEHTISYPFHGDAIEATGRLLRSDRVRKVASNMKFEERWTQHQFGHGVSEWFWDTMLAAHCLDNREGICSLKFQSFIHLGICSYNENVEPYLENYKGHYNRIHEIEISTLLQYGGMDAALEYPLATLQMEHLEMELA